MIRTALEGAGIPVFVSGENYTNLKIPFMPHNLGVFVYLDDQYHDATALIANPSHKVASPVDINAFYRELEDTENKEHLHKATNNFLGLVFVLIIVLGFVMYVLSR